MTTTKMTTVKIAILEKLVRMLEQHDCSEDDLLREKLRADAQRLLRQIKTLREGK